MTIVCFVLMQGQKGEPGEPGPDGAPGENGIDVSKQTHLCKRDDEMK